jgi:hypothetical protein
MADQQRVGDFRVTCDFSGFKVWASETVMTARSAPMPCTCAA